MSEARKPNIHYRVIGIRQEGDRVSLGNNLTSDEAKGIRTVIAEAKIFAQVQIELDTTHREP
jgi:hypothetical protein